MSIRILDLTRQYQQLQAELESAVLDQMRSGVYIGGSAVSDFEAAFAAYVGTRHAVALNSGTDALVIALRSLGIGAGDEVITTPFTFFATAEAIAMVGARPVFADIDPDTYNLDPGKVEACVTSRTKAVLPVHIFGQPAEMPRLREIAARHGIAIIEDACQAVGAALPEGKAGALGDLACFSFFPTKNLGAFGDGGMITTNRDDLAIICRALREHGSGQNGAKAFSWLDGKEDAPEIAQSADALYNPYKYYNYLIAYNSRLDAIQARVLSVKLKYLEQFNQRRAQLANRYSEAFRDLPSLRVPKIKEGAHTVWHQYAIRCLWKNELGDYLSSLDIGSAAFYPVPLHLQKAFTDLGYHPGDLPIAEQVCQETVCLPIYPELTDAEQDQIIQAVIRFCAGKGAEL